LELVAGLSGQLANGLAHILRRLLVELGDADITDVVAIQARSHRAHPNDIAGDRNLDRPVRVVADDPQLDAGIDRAAHLVDGLIEGRPEPRLALRVGDDVVGHDARLGRRCIVARSHDLDQALLHADLHAKPAKPAGRLQPHVLEALGIHVAGMRIEPNQHPEDRRFDELVVVGLVNIFGAHALEHSAEQAELAISVAGSCLGARSVKYEARLYRNKRQGRACHRTEKAERRPAHHPHTSLPAATPRMDRPLFCVCGKSKTWGASPVHYGHGWASTTSSGSPLARDRWWASRNCRVGMKRVARMERESAFTRVFNALCDIRERW